jgi:catechol 2,3-dioxygenase-like lactoylglutathione lyase family enzyme
MSATGEGDGDARGTALAGVRDMKLEVIILPVSDVERAKEFYSGIGWKLDADVEDGGRRVQFTPPGAGCSVQFGSALSSAAPGSAQDMHLIVSDIEATRARLLELDVEVGEVFHCETGTACRFRAQNGKGRMGGAAPDHATYKSFATFTDPDGNGWVLQEVTSRLEGRVEAAATAFNSVPELAAALRRAAAAHGEHEKRIGAQDPDSPDWYAEFMVREQSGAKLPS